MVQDYFLNALSIPQRQNLVGRNFDSIDDLVYTVEQYEAIGLSSPTTIGEVPEA